MAEAELNEFGLLEPGVHPMTLDEVSALFGRFQRTDRRMKLIDRLRQFVKAVRDADARIEIYVDGSFVMGKVEEPDDIDVILILPAEWNAAAELRPFEYNIVSKRMVRKLYGFDMIVVVAGQQTVADAIAFFSQVNPKWRESMGIPPRTTKGLIEVQR